MEAFEWLGLYMVVVWFLLNIKYDDQSHPIVPLKLEMNSQAFEGVNLIDIMIEIWYNVYKIVDDGVWWLNYST